MKFMRRKKILGKAVSLISGYNEMSVENEESDSADNYIKSGFKKLECSDDVWYRTDETGEHMVVIGSGSSPFQAFAERNDIRTLKITGSFSYIDDGAFEKCRNIKEVTIESAGIIKDHAFSQCTGLKKVYVLSVGSIYPNAFSGCINMNSFKAGEIGNISYDAFHGCYDLKEVIICAATPPEISEEAFEKPYPSIIIPELSLEEYTEELGEGFSIKGYDPVPEEGSVSENEPETRQQISFIKINGSLGLSDFRERIPV